MHGSSGGSARANMQNFARAVTLKLADFGVEHVKLTQFFAFVNGTQSHQAQARKKCHPEVFPKILDARKRQRTSARARRAFEDTQEKIVTKQKS